MIDPMAATPRQSDGEKPKRKQSAAQLANLKGGSRKGVPNKTTAAAKQVITDAAERLGGVNRLVEWAKEHPDNEKAFWVSIYPKLIPLDVNANLTKTPSYTVHDFVMKQEPQ